MKKASSGGGERKVRTPEGAKRYGVPIGTPISEAKKVSAARKAGEWKETSGSNKSGSRREGGGRPSNSPTPKGTRAYLGKVDEILARSAGDPEGWKAQPHEAGQQAPLTAAERQARSGKAAKDRQDLVDRADKFRAERAAAKRQARSDKAAKARQELQASLSDAEITQLWEAVRLAGDAGQLEAALGN